MSFGEGGASEVDFETMHGRNWPSITQFSVFLENRVGQLLEVVRAFHGSKVRIVGLTISGASGGSHDALVARAKQLANEVAGEIRTQHKAKP